MMMQMIMMVMDDWCCGILVEVLINSSLECFRGWTVDQVRGGGGVGHSIVLRVLGRMNVCAHQSLSTGWKINFVKLV